VNGMAGTDVSLSYPDDIGIDSAGNILIPATNQQVVLRASLAGIVTVIAGTGKCRLQR